ncbi:MAG: FKBP-type peptidyl-prolyl cis-trans isomerase [Specibacter sp.]
MRRLLALLLPLLLLATACSPGSSDPAAPAPSASVSIPPSNAEVLASVKVQDLGKGKAPKVTFDTPLAIKAESMRLVTPGDGAQIRDGQIIAFQQVMLNAADGKTIGESFTKEQSNKITLDENFKTQFALVHSTFASAKVGAFIAYGTPAVPAVAATAQAAAQPEQPAAMSVFKVISATDAPAVVKPLSKPEGDTVTPPAGLPTVKDNDKGTPVITVGSAKAPTELVSQNLITGKGAALKSSDTIVANYVGVNFVGGEIFDSSFDRGEPATFPLKGVIEGWTKGLTGKTVGSRVLLVIPKAQAYGDAGQGKAKGDLVFVVDILGVTAAQ